MSIFVVGMHRSGTSVVTSLLQGMGAYTGPASGDIGASEENPKGFFEQREVIDLNTSLLATCGCDWHRVAQFDLSTLAANVRRHFCEEIDQIVSRLDTRSPWVLKDPRFCLTLPLWIERCRNAVVVFVHRSPLEVADSLRARNDFQHPFAIALWERYCVGALESCKDSKAVFVSYRDLMDAPLATADRLHTALEGLSVGGLTRLSQVDVAERVAPELYRNTSGHERADEFLNGPQLALLRRLERGKDSAVAAAESAMSAGGQLALEDFELELATVVGAQPPPQRFRRGMSPRYARLEERVHELLELHRRTSDQRKTAEEAYRRAKARMGDLERIVQRARERAEAAEASFRTARIKRDQAIDAFRRERERAMTPRGVEGDTQRRNDERHP